MAVKESPNRYRIEAVDRALSLLNCLAENPDVSASELAHILDANRSLVFRMLATLGERGFVSKNADGRYQLGPQLLYLGLQAEGGNALISATQQVMDRLSEQTRESVVLIVREGLATIRIAFRDSPQDIRLHSGFSARGWLHEGGASKTLLAHAPDDVIELILTHYLDQFIPNSVRTRDRALAMLDDIRAKGYFVSLGGRDGETFSISAPIFDARQNVVAALGVVGPIVRLDDDKCEEFVRSVVDGAALASTRLR